MNHFLQGQIRATTLQNASKITAIWALVLSSLLHDTDLQHHCFQLPASLLQVAILVVTGCHISPLKWIVFTSVHSVACQFQLQRLWLRMPGCGLEQLRHRHMLFCHPCCGEGEVRKSNAGVSNMMHHGRKIHQGSSIGSWTLPRSYSKSFALMWGFESLRLCFVLVFFLLSVLIVLVLFQLTELLYEFSSTEPGQSWPVLPGIVEWTAGRC